jgi:hypothetical protein
MTLEYFESFDDDLGLEWRRYGVRGDGEVVTEARGRVARLGAGEMIADQVGKASIIYEFPQPLREGDLLDIAAAFKLPPLRGGRISLIDLECKYCGIETQPGFRLFMNEERAFYLERGKIGYGESFFQDRPPLAPVDTWFHIRWQTLFGRDEGESRLWLDGALIAFARGANFPDFRVAQRLGAPLTAEQLDRVEIGITANSQPEPVVIYMDDIEIIASYQN